MYTHTLAIPHYLFAANYPLERHDVTIIFCGRQIHDKKGQNLCQRGLRDRGTQTWDDRCSGALSEFQAVERKLRWRMIKRRRRQKGWRGKKPSLRRRQKEAGEDRKWLWHLRSSAEALAQKRPDGSPNSLMMLRRSNHFQRKRAW